MPLISFGINTRFFSILDTKAQGMTLSGDFRLTHMFKEPPPPETEYTLKMVYISSSGEGRIKSRGENKEPTTWVDINFPQLSDQIIATYPNWRRGHFNRYEGSANNPYFSYNSGILRFPITELPVDGVVVANRALDSNLHTRNGNNSSQSHYTHKAQHIVNIPLGKMRLDENKIDVILTPFNRQDRQLLDVTNSRFPNIRNIQLILEYK